MIRRTQDLSRAARDRFDSIIDVRSPAEFEEDHVPGAINLPVLDNAERIEVGTLYVQTSKFLARRIGAAKVARNIAHHLETALADRDSTFRPLVYCWRGGQRSGAMATVMEQVGWPVMVLEGGYKRWRRQVVALLYETPADAPQLQMILLQGRTGCGKTALLQQLQASGHQTLDLEGLAQHRGSLFGAMAAGQPSQKRFETRLVEAIETLDPARPLFVEAESSRIGEITLPPRIWSAMQQAPRITLSAPVEARTRHILAHYADIADNKSALEEALSRLPRHHSRETMAHWRSLAATGATAPLIEGLIRAHYDPSYDRWTARQDCTTLGTVAVDLSPEGIVQAARQIAEMAGKP